MSLKLNIKKFTGTLKSNYRISWYVSGGYVYIKLTIDMGNECKITEIAQGSKIEDSSYQESLRDALVRAEDKWNIQLTKANMNVLPIEKTA